MFDRNNLELVPHDPLALKASTDGHPHPSIKVCTLFIYLWMAKNELLRQIRVDVPRVAVGLEMVVKNPGTLEDQGISDLRGLGECLQDQPQDFFTPVFVIGLIHTRTPQDDLVVPDAKPGRSGTTGSGSTSRSIAI